LKEIGIEIEPTKTGKVKNNFKFLGVEFDIEKEEVRYRESKLSWKGINLAEKSNVEDIKT